MGKIISFINKSKNKNDKSREFIKLNANKQMNYLQ